MINKVTLKNFKCFENMTIDCKGWKKHVFPCRYRTL